jgi:hypothetical protein
LEGDPHLSLKTAVNIHELIVSHVHNYLFHHNIAYFSYTVVVPIVVGVVFEASLRHIGGVWWDSVNAKADGMKKQG